MASRSFSDPETERIAAFLREIGLVVTRGPVDDASFLPGIEVVPNGLRVDETRLAHPGDLLHEAGHLAVLSPAERAAAAGDVGDDGGLEMAAIAWSYAAAVHLRLDPAIVFHPDGYRGASRALIENFSAGHTFGVPVLQWLGLAVEPQRVPRARLTRPAGLPGHGPLAARRGGPRQRPIRGRRRGLRCRRGSYDSDECAEVAV